MVLARKSGIKSQRELAGQLGIGMTTLSNILRGRSRGTAALREKMEKRFGQSFDELIQTVEVQ
jgi:transcriptional regulator with XRE-family HTH domain